jgi:uncharacterized protein YutE (UPF0331/DUF86 family)
MMTALIRSAIVTERVSWVRTMLAALRRLPLSTYEEFMADPRNPAAAESYLRRALEALLDVGRHILAKGFAVAVPEYKDIGPRLYEEGALSEENARLLRRMAGYRNRMVHFYHEIGHEELYAISTQHLRDIEKACEAMMSWFRDHPDKIDHTI